MDTKAKTITLTEEEFDLIVMLMYVINRDKDGSFFICEENEKLINQINEMIDRH